MDTRHGIEFDRVHNAATDLGWERDEGGEEVVNSLPTEDGTLIAVPDGEWVVGRNVLSSPERWGIVGLGENVTLRAPASNCVRMIQVSGNHPGRDIVVENITFDQRDDDQTGISLNLPVHDGLFVVNCQRVGRTPNRHTAGPPYGEEPVGIVCDVRDPDGNARIENWTDLCETRVVDYPLNAASIFAGFHSEGTITLRNCHIENQGEHAAYMSKAKAVEVEGGVFRNNVNTNMRIAGEGSYIEDATLGVDFDREYARKADTGDLKATKLLRWEHSREYGVAGGHIENCVFEFETSGLPQPILCYIMGNAGGVRLENNVFRNDSDARGVVVQAVGEGWRGYEPPVPDVRLRHNRFVGSSANPPVDAERPGAVHDENCEYDMPNAPKPRGLAD